MAKDRTLQAIQSAVESGTLKAGASKLLNTYIPLPYDPEIILQNYEGDRSVALRHIHIDGLRSDKTVKITTESWIGSDHRTYRPDIITVYYNNELSEQAVKEIEVRDVENIQEIVIDIQEDSLTQQIVKLVDFEEVPLDGFRLTADGATIESPDGIQYIAYFSEYPYILHAQLPEGATVEGWYYDDITEETKIGDDVNQVIDQFYSILILNIKEN